MQIEFDPEKNRTNLEKHGLELSIANEFEIDEALIAREMRFDYGEDRFIAIGPLRGRIRVLVFTPRGGKLRPISLRNANPKESEHYERHRPR